MFSCLYYKTAEKLKRITVCCLWYDRKDGTEEQDICSYSNGLLQGLIHENSEEENPKKETMERFSGEVESCLCFLIVRSRFWISWVILLRESKGPFVFLNLFHVLIHINTCHTVKYLV